MAVFLLYDYQSVEHREESQTPMVVEANSCPFPFNLNLGIYGSSTISFDSTNPAIVSQIHYHIRVQHDLVHPMVVAILV